MSSGLFQTIGSKKERKKKGLVNQNKEMGDSKEREGSIDTMELVALLSILLLRSENA